jgi:hypothetical protein
MTPTLPASATAEAADSAGAALSELLLEEPPHAATSSDAAARPATAPMILRDIKVFPFIVWVDP